MTVSPHPPLTGGGVAPTLVYLPLSAITPYASNPRKNADAIPAVKASILEFGWQQPLVVDAQHVIVIGDTRYRAACELAAEGEKSRDEAKVPCFVASHLSPARIKALRVIDNKSHEKAKWDYELLQLEFAEFDLTTPLFQLNFDQHELDVIQAADWTPPTVNENDTSTAYGNETEGSTAPTSLTFSVEEWAIIDEALTRWVVVTESDHLPPRPALVALCKDYMRRVAHE